MAASAANSTGAADDTTAGNAASAVGRSCLHLEVFPVAGDHSKDCLLKDLLDALHLFAAALHILSAHLLRDRKTLFRCHRREPLSLEHVDACLLVPQVGFQAHQNQGRVWAEVQNFWVPLFCQSTSATFFVEILGKK